MHIHIGYTSSRYYDDASIEDDDYYHNAMGGGGEVAGYYGAEEEASLRLSWASAGVEGDASSVHLDETSVASALSAGNSAVVRNSSPSVRKADRK